MAMNIITKKKSIPSILIDKDFIFKLGNILESETRERIQSANIEADKEITKRKLKIEKSRQYSTEEKETEIREMADYVRKISTPHLSVSYKLNTDDNQSVEFFSVEDMLSTNLLPRGIQNMSVYVHHYNKEFVDVSLNIDKPIGMFFTLSPKEFELSSQDEGKLLKVEKDLENLFTQSRFGYHTFLYPQSNLSYMPVFIVSLLVSLAVSYTFYKLKADDPEFILSEMYIGFIYIIIFVYYIVSKIIKYSFPFYEFNLTSEKNYSRTLKGIISAIVSLIILNGVYDLIKFLIS
jgi:hypothetical protein